MAYEDNIKHQLAILDIIWEEFKASGVTDKPELVLEFVYLAPNKKFANSLNAILNVYDSSVRSERWFKKKWYVYGKSYPIAVSKDSLSQWLDFMVSLGWEHESEFYRFGTSTPYNQHQTH